jgi:CRISPR-associated endonuclease Csn1
LNTEEIRYVICKDLESIKASMLRKHSRDEMVKEKVKNAIFLNKVLLISIKRTTKKTNY